MSENSAIGTMGAFDSDHVRTSQSLQITEEFALNKCDHFVDMQLWPLTSHLNPRGWLSNFTSEEKPFAINLLHNFLYFNERLMEQLLRSAFQDLSRIIRGEEKVYSSVRTQWQQFFDEVIITCVRGERPNATDSGLKFLRMARQVLRIDENRILSPDETLARFRVGVRCPIIFLDDFVGSGQQFVSTWTRKVSLSYHSPVSFEDIESEYPDLRTFYCPLICTETGQRNIKIRCPRVTLNPAHLLPDNYSALSTESVVWPPEMRISGPKFIESVSLRANIPGWRGFHNLGLSLAFEHSVPDATLPIFHWNENGWIPLIERK